MKKLKLVLAVVVLLAVNWACKESKERYIDLSTGKAIDVEKDEKSGFMVNKETGEVLYIYVDTKNKDTIYGKTGKVINGYVRLDDDNKYVYMNETLKTDGNYKVEVEKDGDVKIKSEDKKIKIDGETGEKKVKND